MKIAILGDVSYGSQPPPARRFRTVLNFGIRHDAKLFAAGPGQHRFGRLISHAQVKR
ncbi:hypothetical protein [Lysobacter sp. Root690]|uniref:hypothetical protein n=1 Tax=Lysobacter sp. Root690 TaxID=1736588 RepID=UPI000A9E4232|nr:hypothetical protein [Lysobacter sp. Root690]